MTAARLAVAAAAVLGAAGCASAATETVNPVPPGETLVSPAASHPPLHAESNPGHVTGTLGEPGKGHWCDAAPGPGGTLPDPDCTPGGYDPQLTAAVLCAAGYTTRSYRPPAAETARFERRQAAPAYGVTDLPAHVLDHLVSLSIGGNNSAANLWDQADADGRAKDRVEAGLRAWVCAKGIPPAQAQGRLETAQQAEAADWITALQVTGAAGH